MKNLQNFNRFLFYRLMRIGKYIDERNDIMQNQEIKDYAKVSGVKLWQVAEELGMHDSNFSKLLRHKLSEENENKICDIIDRLAAKNKSKEGEIN